MKQLWMLVLLMSMGVMGLAEPPFAGIPSPFRTFDQIVNSDEGKCSYTEEGIVAKLLDGYHPTEPAVSYCMRAGKCELGDSVADYVFTCRAEDGKCPENPKDCYKRAVKDGNPVSFLSVLSPNEDEKTAEFEGCVYAEHSPRTVFYKVGAALTQYYAVCLAEVKGCKGDKAPRSIVCDGEAAVRTSEGAAMQCPGVNKCLNNRFKTGESYPK